MDIKIKEEFSVLWKKYFSDAKLPIIFYYTNEEGHAKLVKSGSVPMNKFVRMIKNMEESFLITDSWRKVQKRISLVEC